MSETNDPNTPIGREEFYQAMVNVFTFIMLSLLAQSLDKEWLTTLMTLFAVVALSYYSVKWNRLRQKPGDSGTETEG